MTDRLLLLSCSATKRPDAGLLPARERYNGPLWQTLRVADPDGTLAACWAMSSRFGMLRADQGIPDYNQLMTLERSAQLSASPLCSAWGRRELPRVEGELGDRWCAAAFLNRSPVPPGGYREVAIVGGCHYLPFGQACLRDMILFGHVARDAVVTVINGEIGNMRRDLRSWLVQPLSLARAA